MEVFLYKLSKLYLLIARGITAESTAQHIPPHLAGGGGSRWLRAGGGGWRLAKHGGETEGNVDVETHQQGHQCPGRKC